MILVVVNRNFDDSSWCSSVFCHTWRILLSYRHTIDNSVSRLDVPSDGRSCKAERKLFFIYHSLTNEHTPELWYGIEWRTDRESCHSPAWWQNLANWVHTILGRGKSFILVDLTCRATALPRIRSGDSPQLFGTFLTNHFAKSLVRLWVFGVGESPPTQHYLLFVNIIIQFLYIVFSL